MSSIRPFAGIRYTTAASPDLSALLAPPYDIIDEAGKGELLARHPHNFVTIDLPHVPPKSAGPPAAYATANATLERWLADGVMARDPHPAIYVYHQAYRFSGIGYVRKMFFARLKLEPFGEGSIFPHERTFGGPKEDRLALTKATRANLSPVFGLYEDADNVVAAHLEAALPPKPWAFGTLDGVDNRLWAVTDPHVITDTVQRMAPKAIYIADGHHRTGTAMLYRDWLAEQRGALPPEHPANFVLCVFCAMEDPGLLILPTHRVLPDMRVTVDLLEADARIRCHPLDVAGPSEAIAALAAYGPQAVALFDPQADRYYAVCPARPDVLDSLEPDHAEAWRRLGLAFLHACLLDRVLVPRLRDGRPPEIHYVKSDDGAVREARERRGAAFLMQPTTMAELRAVCRAGDLMPQKSTYFYPKLASGLVINPLY